MKGVRRFRKRGKLNLRYVGPFEVVEKIGSMAYRVALSTGLGDIPYVFHVFTLRLKFQAIGTLHSQSW